MTEQERGRTNRGQKNTGWEFDLVDESKPHDDPWMQWGNYETRHKAIGMKVFLERFLEGDYEFEVRAHPTMWEERDSPVVCGYCGYEDWYYPQVGWVYPADVEDSPFCTKQCWARYQRENELTGAWA